jgi:hypothetical protein
MTQQASMGSVSQDGFPGWRGGYLRHRYAVLFYSLILTLIVAPILKAIGLHANVMQLFLGLNLLAASIPLESRKGRWVLPAIVLVAIVLRIGSLQAGHAGLSTLSLWLWTAIGLYAVFIALRFALRSHVITSEHLYAALSAYLLAGVFMGVLYWSLDQVWPNSIIVNGPGHPSRSSRWKASTSASSRLRPWATEIWSREMTWFAILRLWKPLPGSSISP